MSKERLESLKRNKEWTEATGGKFHTVDKEDYEWLIGQAKRVRELEKDIKEWEIVNESWEEINTHLVEQNKRYREVIEEAREYANSPKILTNPAGIKKILAKALEGEE